MRDIVEELRSAIANQQVDVNAIAELVADLLPRTISFDSLSDSGYVSGNVLAWWVAEEDVIFKANLPKSGAFYKLDNLHAVLPTTSRIGIRKYGGAAMGYLRFDIGGAKMVPEFPADVIIRAGESVEFFVDSLPGIAAVSVTVPHFLYKTGG